MKTKNILIISLVLWFFNLNIALAVGNQTQHYTEKPVYSTELYKGEFKRIIDGQRKKKAKNHNLHVHILNSNEIKMALFIIPESNRAALFKIEPAGESYFLKRILIDNSENFLISSNKVSYVMEKYKSTNKVVKIKIEAEDTDCNWFDSITLEGSLEANWKNNNYLWAEIPDQAMFLEGKNSNYSFYPGKYNEYDGKYYDGKYDGPISQSIKKSFSVHYVTPYLSNLRTRSASSDTANGWDSNHEIEASLVALQFKNKYQFLFLDVIDNNSCLHGFFRMNIEMNDGLKNKERLK